MCLEQKVFHALTERMHWPIDKLCKVLDISSRELLLTSQQLQAKGFPLKTLESEIFLTEPIDAFNLNDIECHLIPHAQACITDIDLFFNTESTNDYLVDKAQTKNCHGHVCISEYQSKARGRQGKQWRTPLGKQIALSLCWRFDSGCSLDGLSLAIGVALVDALKQYDINDIQLKWPNDMVYQNQKLGGILIEVLPTPGVTTIVVGIGINAHPITLSHELEQPTTSIAELNDCSFSRNRITGLILNNLTGCLIDFEQFGFKKFMHSWLEYDALKDHFVQISHNNKTDNGRYLGVDELGHIEVEVNGHRQTFVSGTVRKL